MDNMEEKLSSILGNPQMMQQIMAMAQSFGQAQQEQSRPEPPPPAASAMPDIDPAMLTKVISLAGKTGPDQNQQTLLKALRPYLTAQRIEKLEKAMRAAKLANVASSFLGNFSATGR